MAMTFDQCLYIWLSENAHCSLGLFLAEVLVVVRVKFFDDESNGHVLKAVECLV